jgi:O-antigen/teichoic acid export membrane protein
MSLAAKAAKAGKISAIYAMGSIIAQLVALFTLPFFTRVLSPAQMGVVQVATQFLLFMGILMQLGLFSGLKSVYFRSEPATREQLVRSVQIGQWVQGGLLAIVLSIAPLPWLGRILPDTLPLGYELRVWLWWMIVWGGYLGSLVRVGGGLAQLREDPVPFVVISMATLFIGVAVGVILVLGFGGFGFFRQAGTFMGTLAAGLLASWYMWQHGSGRISSRLFLRTFKVGLTFVPHAISGVLISFASMWLVAALDSAGSAGIYGIAVSFAMLITMPLQAIGHALYPTLAGMMREGTVEAKRQHVRFYLFIVAGTIFLGLGLSLFAPVVIRMLTAPEYHEAVYINAILIIAWMFEGFYLTVSQPVFFFGGGWYMTLASFGSFLVLLGLSNWLIPLFGAYGAALAMVGCFMTKMSISGVCSHKLYPLKWDLPPLVKLLLAAALLGIIDFVWVDTWSVWLAVPMKCLLAAAYIPLVIWSGIVSKAEAAWGVRQIKAKLGERFGKRGKE